MVWIAQYPQILVNVKKPFLTVQTVNFQSNRNLLVEKNVDLHSHLTQKVKLTIPSQKCTSDNQNHNNCENNNLCEQDVVL